MDFKIFITILFFTVVLCVIFYKRKNRTSTKEAPLPIEKETDTTNTNITVAEVSSDISTQICRSENLKQAEQLEITPLINIILRDPSVNFFIQGAAGTGKSTLIRQLQESTSRKICIAAPTGLAAVNVGGSTIHSLFGLPAFDFFDVKKVKLSARVQSLLEIIDLIIIDEVSMVRPDMFDAMNKLACEARGSDKPFGGIQIVFIGDLYQLQPIIKKNVKDFFKQEYGCKDAFFFDAHTFQKAHFSKFKRTKVHRQHDPELLHHLETIRMKKKNHIQDALDYFNSSKIHDTETLKNALYIASKNDIVRTKNFEQLRRINSPLRTYSAIIYGEYEKQDYPAPEELQVKVGAKVILNRSIEKFVNGTLAFVTDLEDNSITVRIEKTEYYEETYLNIVRVKWENLAYKRNEDTNEIEERPIGSFEQFPLQLGYALTIHKAQGKTLEKVIIGAKTKMFAHGQLYVALSRTRKRSDIHIEGAITLGDVIVHDRVAQFLKD